MKKILKLEFMFLLLCFICLVIIPVDAASSTGHKEFTNITFLYNKEAKLLVQMTNSEKNKMLNKVTRKGFGWNSKTNYHNYKVVYEAGSIFSRSNNTSNPIEINYSTNATTKKQLSINTSGSIALKTSGKIDQVSKGLDAEIRTDIGVKNEVIFEEAIDFDIIIAPGKKVSLLVKGIATLSNGAAKYYLFGIPIKKGYWEYVDVEHEYYELYEEDITY